MKIGALGGRIGPAVHETHGKRLKALLWASGQPSACADGALSTPMDSVSSCDISRQAAWATMEGKVMNRVPCV